MKNQPQRAEYRFFSDTYIENQIVMRKKYRFFLSQQSRNQVEIGLFLEVGTVFHHRVFAQAEEVGFFLRAELEEGQNDKVQLRLAEVGVG